MRATISLLIAAAAACAQPALAKNGPPLVLEHSNKWEMRYDEDACNLQTEFGSGSDVVAMVITRTSPGDWFDMKLYGKRLSQFGLMMPVKISFGDGPMIEVSALSATAGTAKKFPVAILSGLRIDGWQGSGKRGDLVPPLIASEREAAVLGVTVRAASRPAFRLETGSLGKPFAAMRACTDDLLRHWGFDPAVQANLSRYATPASNPTNWLGSDDFPKAALNEGMNGLVRFRLNIDAAGAVSDCRILYRTNPDEFADTSCRLISKRARFIAALDAGGKPVASYYISEVRWFSSPP